MINGIKVVTRLNIDIKFRTVSEYSKMAKQVLLITLVVLSTTLAGVFSALSCYTCNSSDDPTCVDPMNRDVNATVCDSDFFVCMRISYIAKNTFVTARGCQVGYIDPCSYTYSDLHKAYPDVTSFNCYWCMEDYCNSANGSKIQRQLMKEDIDSNLRKEKPVKPFYLSP